MQKAIKHKEEFLRDEHGRKKIGNKAKAQREADRLAKRSTGLIDARGEIEEHNEFYLIHVRGGIRQ